MKVREFGPMKLVSFIIYIFIYINNNK